MILRSSSILVQKKINYNSTLLSQILFFATLKMHIHT